MQLSIFSDIDVRDSEEVEPSSFLTSEPQGAEFLVAADICLRGYSCMMAGPGLRYDIVADIGGLRRIQVKMTRAARVKTKNNKYSYQRYWFDQARNGGLLDYKGDIDLFAFVALDIRSILYVPITDLSVGHVSFVRSDFALERIEMSWRTIITRWSANV